MFRHARAAGIRMTREEIGPGLILSRRPRASGKRVDRYLLRQRGADWRGFFGTGDHNSLSIVTLDCALIILLCHPPM